MSLNIRIISKERGRWLLLLALFLAFLPARAQSPNVVIQGSLGNNPVLPVVKLEAMQGKPLLLASDTMKNDGNFAFFMEVKEPGIFRLSQSDKDFLMLILHPGDTVRLMTSSGSLSAGLNITGSYENQLLHMTGYHVGQYEKVLDSLQKVFQQLNGIKAPDAEIRAVQQDFMRVRGLMYQYIQNGITTQPRSLVWLFFIEKMDMEEQFPWYARLVDTLIVYHPTNVYVKSLYDKVSNERKLAIGSPAPDITGPDPDGKEHSLSDYRGKVVLIDFWAGWCGPCRKENPNLVRLYAEYKDKGFEIFGVSLDRTRESWVNAIKADGLTWPQVSDLKYWQSELSKEYKVSSIPHTVLIDQEGRIIAKKLRGQALEDRLKLLLGGSE